MNKLTSILTAFLLLLGSCQADEWKEEGTHLSDREGFTLSYSISAPISAVTKASVPTEEGEDKVNSFYILFFENVVGGNGTFVEAIDALGAYEASLGSSGKLEIIFPDDSNLKGAAEYKMILLANIENYLTNINSVEDLNFYLEGMKEREAANMLFCIKGVEPGEGEETDNSNRIPSANLPMSASAVKKAKEAEVSIELFRAVSRFDVFSTADGYELVSASIWNAHTETTWIPSDSFEYTNSRTGRFYGVNATNGEITGTLYAFENRSESPSQKDKETTCLIIGLKKAGENTVEYFRTNINVINQSQKLYRNTVYRTIIRSVNGMGDDTERGAYENGKVLLDVDINGWTLDESGSIHIDGETVLAIPTNEINLCSMGEIREYNVYTIGEGYPEISERDLPEGITARITTPSHYTDKNFKKSILTIESTSTDFSRSGKIIISFKTFNSIIRINQNAPQEDFLNLSVYELPTFSFLSGETYPQIIVTSSGRWEAEIHNGTFFSFTSSSTQTAKADGGSGESFDIHTIKENEDPENRYCFVKVSLKEKPSVSRLLVLEQEGTPGKYIKVNPTSFAMISAGGGSTPNITVASSGDWEAVVTINTPYSNAYFDKPLNEDDDDEEDDEGDGSDKDGDGDDDETGPDTWEGSNGDAFIVTLTGMSHFDIPAIATVTVFLKEDPTVFKTFTIDQKALSGDNIILQSRKYSRPGALFNLKRSNTYRYVFNMATNMRDTKLFGPDGIVPMGDEYVFLKSGVRPIEGANIFQITGNASTADFKNYIVPWWKNKTNRFLFFCDNNVNVRYSMIHLQNSSANSGISGYTVNTGSAKIAATTDRKFYSGSNNNHRNSSLVKYILEEGPFGEVNANNISLKGKSNTNRVLTKWPDTFIPLIMAGTDNKKCIFGIDPVNRIIFLGDPAIFGSSKAQDENSTNFSSNEDNVRFMNNVIAWITNSVMLDDDFEYR